MAKNKARLLLIDDEETVLKLVNTVLSRAGYDVVVCNSGVAALQLLQTNKFACIITDAIMPIMSGYDFVRTTRGQPEYENIPILMLTRKRHREDVKRAVEVGVTDYVLKPIDEALLLDKVELCIKKSAGRRQVFECAITGDDSQATASVSARIISVSESDLTLVTPFKVHPNSTVDIRSGLFEKIGIQKPLLKLVESIPVPEEQPEKGVPGYRSKFTFIGVPESDLSKIRMWLQKEEIRQRR